LSESIDVGKRKLIPTRSYDIKIVIKDKDYTANLSTVRILNSLVMPYPLILFELFIDPTDVILEKIYGKEPIYLNIRLLGRSNESDVFEETNFELMSTGNDMPLIQKSTFYEKSYTPLKLVFTTVPRSSFSTATTFINTIGFNTTPRNLISNLVSRYTGAFLDYDTNKENLNTIGQILLPPATLYNTIQEIDSLHGLHNGATSVYCRYNNVLSVMNLTERIYRNQIFTITHLSTDTDNSKIIEESVDGKHFYTYFPIKTDFQNNSKFMELAKNIKYILKPDDRLYYKIEKNLESVCNSYGLISSNGYVDLFIDPELEKRIKYELYPGSGNLSDIFINSYLSKQIADLSQIELQIEKNFPIEGLMNVGCPVNFRAKSIDYTDFVGKYILKSSDISFTRTTPDWRSVSSLYLIRTNKIK